MIFPNSLKYINYDKRYTITDKLILNFAFRILNSNYIIIATTVAMANTIILRELSPIS